MFTKEALTDLLNELTGAQESIEKVSLWLQQYKDQAPVIAQTWKNLYYEASKEKKLTLLFLVNDVLQHTKRKGSQFVDAFGFILPKCLSECKEFETKFQIERMLDIWESREVFHKHIISAMKYNLDAIGMEDSQVKLTDLMDSLDLLRSQEKKSSEVLTKLSHRLDTTDFANAFNVSSRKEGDKYAADFDETAHFLDQYCSCLLKQTEARTDMIRKMNTTLYQMEKSEETLKSSDKEYKNQQASLVKTRKAITSRQMLIDEGMVNFGDDSPDREQIENLTSEEEDVDIEGMETVESNKMERTIKAALLSYTTFCLNLERNEAFRSILEMYGISKESSTMEWMCIYYLAVLFILSRLISWLKIIGHRQSSVKFDILSSHSESFINNIANSVQSSYQVMVMTGHYGPKLPEENTNSAGNESKNDEKFGPALPNQKQHESSLPQTSVSGFNPSISHSDVNTFMYGPALPSANTPIEADPSNNAGISFQQYSSFGPALPPSLSFSSFPSAKICQKDEKFGPVVPDNSFRGSNLPQVPENCHTSIERLLSLYNIDPEVEPGSETSLQHVFGGAARGYDPNEEEKQPKIISKSLTLSPKSEITDKVSHEPLDCDNLRPSGKTFLKEFEPPKFSTFPSEKVDAVIKGKVDGSIGYDGKEDTFTRSHESKRKRSDSCRNRSGESSKRGERDLHPKRDYNIQSPQINPAGMSLQDNRNIPPMLPAGPTLPPMSNAGFRPPVLQGSTQVPYGPSVPFNIQPLSPFGPPMPPNSQHNIFSTPSGTPNQSFGPPMPPINYNNAQRPNLGPMPMNNMMPPNVPFRGPVGHLSGQIPGLVPTTPNTSSMNGGPPVMMNGRGLSPMGANGNLPRQFYIDPRQFRPTL